VLNQDCDGWKVVTFGSDKDNFLYWNWSRTSPTISVTRKAHRDQKSPSVLCRIKHPVFAMPIIVVCPKCSAKLSAPDYAAGKKVKCPRAECGTILAVFAPAPLPLEPDDVNEAPPAPAPKQLAAVAKAKAPARQEAPPVSNDPFNDDRDEESPEPARAKRKRVDEDDEDDKRPVRNRRRGGDDDEDDDARPARNRRRGSDDGDRPRKNQKKKSSGISPVLIGAIAGGALLLLGSVGLAIYLFSGSSKDKGTIAGSTSGGGVLFPSPKTAVPAGWVEFNEAGVGFKAYFPSKPNSVNNGDEKVYTVEDGTLNFLVVAKRQGVLIDPFNRKQVVDEFISKTFTEQEGSKLLSQKEATLAGQPAMEVLAAAPAEEKAPLAKGGNPKSKSGAKDPAPEEGDPGRGVFRIVAKGNQVFVVGVIAKNGLPPSEQVNAFFDNFELLEPRAPKPGDLPRPSNSPRPSGPFVGNQPPSNSPRPNGPFVGNQPPSNSPRPNSPVAGNQPPRTNGPPSTNPTQPNDPQSAEAGGSENLARIQKLTEQAEALAKSSNEAMNKCIDAATAQDTARTLKENADRVKKFAQELKGIGPLTATEINALRAKYSKGMSRADMKAATEAGKKIEELFGPKSKLDDDAKKDLKAAYDAYLDASVDFGFSIVGLMLPPKK
jgi:hypothetical protein